MVWLKRKGVTKKLKKVEGSWVEGASIQQCFKIFGKTFEILIVIDSCYNYTGNLDKQLKTSIDNP